MTAATFGNFDGVHMGHRALLADVRQAAARIGGQSLVVTFDPHPLAVLRPERAPRMVDNLAGRLQGMQQCGVEVAVVLRFDMAMSQRSAHWFAHDLLLDQLGARSLTVGADTRFGHGGTGTFALLQTLGGQVGATVTARPPVVHRGEVVSSSRVRRAVEAGDVELAGELLARPFALRGEVVLGDQRGRTLGFPTANIAAPSQIQPAAGVYATWLVLQDGRHLPSVTNCGMRPTFAGTQWRVETYALDFSGDLYGQRVSVAFVRRLRAEQRFDGPGALTAQIHRDVAAGRIALEAP